MRWLWWATIATLALCATIATAPAHLAVRLLPQPANAFGIQGTLWKGRVRALELTRGLTLSAEWRLRWLPLLLGRLSWQTRLDGDWGHAQFATLLGPGNRFGLVDAQARIVLHAIPQQPLVGPVRIAGELLVQDLMLRGDASGPTAAAGRLLWTDARILSPVAADLDRIVAEIRTSPTTPEHRAVLSGSGGDLLVVGEFSLGSGWRYRLQSTVTTTQAADPQITQTLDWLLARTPAADERGPYQLDLEGRLGSSGAR